MSWVAVVGSDPVSVRQLDICRAVRPPEVAGAVRCDDLDNLNEPACLATPSFPVFCNLETKECTAAGLRVTREDFAELSRTGASSQTTPPAPPP
jgi:hypothetical protein